MAIFRIEIEAHNGYTYIRDFDAADSHPAGRVLSGRLAESELFADHTTPRPHDRSNDQRVDDVLANFNRVERAALQTEGEQLAMRMVRVDRGTRFAWRATLLEPCAVAG